MERKIINLRSELSKVIGTYMSNEDVSEHSAIRDILTDMIHISSDKNIDFEEALIGAKEVINYEDERKPRKQKLFTVVTKVLINAEDDVSYEEVLENMDYEFKSRTEDAEIVNTQIIEW